MRRQAKLLGALEQLQIEEYSIIQTPDIEAGEVIIDIRPNNSKDVFLGRWEGPIGQLIAFAEYIRPSDPQRSPFGDGQR